MARDRRNNVKAPRASYAPNQNQYPNAPPPGGRPRNPRALKREPTMESSPSSDSDELDSDELESDELDSDDDDDEAGGTGTYTGSANSQKYSRFGPEGPSMHMLTPEQIEKVRSGRMTFVDHWGSNEGAKAIRAWKRNSCLALLGYMVVGIVNMVGCFLIYKVDENWYYHAISVVGQLIAASLSLLSYFQVSRWRPMDLDEDGDVPRLSPIITIILLVVMGFLFVFDFVDFVVTLIMAANNLGLPKFIPPMFFVNLAASTFVNCWAISTLFGDFPQLIYWNIGVWEDVKDADNETSAAQRGAQESHFRR